MRDIESRPELPSVLQHLISKLQNNLRTLVERSKSEMTTEKCYTHNATKNIRNAGILYYLNIQYVVQFNLHSKK
jgi:hypothetical protein